MVNYLIGIRLFYQNQWEMAEEFLKETLEYPELEEQRLIVLLQIYRHSQKWNLHKRTFDVLCQSNENHRVTMFCKEEHARFVFLRE